jgi:hypothetical protein
VETGSREENASNKAAEPSFRFNRNEEAPKRQSGADPVSRPPGTLTTPENTHPGAII